MTGLGLLHDPIAPHAGRASSRADSRSHAAILSLYHEHRDGLLRLARLVTPEDGTAEDLVQETFVRLYRSLGRINDPAKVPAYLRSMLLNLARGRGRRMAVARKHPERAGIAGGSPEDGALSGDRRRVVLAALRRLSVRQRECIALRHYEGVTESEIATALGISVGSVRTLVSRGAAALTQLLGDQR